jgi:exopolyphosphatase / guanosine-5'-triphosphate,3'-diphosphate pyrophosphatase
VTGGGAVAAVDGGTNATRLLVADAEGRPLLRRQVITHLGEGVDRTGRLAPEAIERVLATLRTYRRDLDDHGVERVRMAATSACRDAANRNELFDAVEDVLGIRPELLSGDEEGRLSFAGATASLDPDLGPFLVVDIGGGSTELVVGRTAPTGVRSIDLGSVRLTERFLHSDPPEAGELSDALSVLRVHLDDVVREVPGMLDAARLVGVSGTVVSVAAIELGLPALACTTSA